MLSKWGKDIDIPERLTREEVQEMIDDAIRKHNRNASIISFCVGWVVLALLLVSVFLGYQYPFPTY